ncbi:hypothetical protein Y032_0092g2601 [Ancylostoma ceylanicum]|uniref:Uncharacterized protein n=1 Tax=Ancylostoma ceylanicum TaxID=53326 RepID=A0A016TM09_9BILA|nr:hypothetical protein Y032_0092g2601 [Ancylostoma ceylanicum]
MELHMANQEQEVYEGPNNGGARQYMAEALATKHGKHSAMCYRIPGTDETYTFTFKRISKDHQLYQCQQCKSKGKWTGIRCRAKYRVHQTPSRLESILCPFQAFGRNLACMYLYLEMS